MATSVKQAAVYVPYRALLSEGSYAHEMRDGCWDCAPFWKEIPTCPNGHGKLTGKGFCRDCRKHYALNAP